MSRAWFCLACALVLGYRRHDGDIDLTPAAVAWQRAGIGFVIICRCCAPRAYLEGTIHAAPAPYAA